jgi:hypothetical protein
MYALSHIQELQTLDISRPKSKPQTANPCCSGYRTAGTVEVLVPVRNVLMHHFNLPLAYLHQPRVYGSLHFKRYYLSPPLPRQIS